MKRLTLALSFLLIVLLLSSNIVLSQKPSATALSQRPSDPDMILFKKEIWCGFWDMWEKPLEGTWVDSGGAPGQFQTYNPGYPPPPEASLYEDISYYVETDVTEEMFNSADFIWSNSVKDWETYKEKYIEYKPYDYHKHSPDTQGFTTLGDYIFMKPRGSKQEELERLYGPGKYLGHRLLLPRYVEWYGKIPKTNFALEELKLVSRVDSGELFVIRYQIFNDSINFANIPVRFTFNGQEKSQLVEVREHDHRSLIYRLLAPINQTDEPQEYYLTVEINPVTNGNRKYVEDKYPYYEDNIRQIVVVVPPEEKEVKSSSGGMGRPILVK